MRCDSLYQGRPERILGYMWKRGGEDVVIQGRFTVNGDELRIDVSLLDVKCFCKVT